MVENDVVIIAASMPMLRALWTKSARATTYPSSGVASGVAIKRSQAATTAKAASGSMSDDEEHMLRDLNNKHPGYIERTTETTLVISSK